MSREQSQSDARPVALITGAGSGIGLATAVELSRHRWSLALLGRSRERLDSARDECVQNGAAAVETLETDLSDLDAAIGAIDRVEARYGRLDALVNNAGTGARHSIDATSPDLLQRTFAVNTFSPALLIGRAWPLLEQTRAANPRARSPAVVNISSMATIDPFPGLFIYAASKAALESFVRSIQNEGGDAIRGFAIAPGSVETALLRSAFDEDIVPRSRTLPPEHVARVIVDCILGRRDSQAGQTIVVASP